MKDILVVSSGSQGPAGTPGNTGGVILISGMGNPEGVQSALVGTIYIRKDGGLDTTLYVKEKGTGNTGWTAK